MKNPAILALSLCAVALFAASCKSQESAYRQAYERARAQEMNKPTQTVTIIPQNTQPQPVQPAPVQQPAAPVVQRTVVVEEDNTPVRTIQVADQIPLVGVSLVTTRSLLDSRHQDLETVVKASIKGMTAFVKDPDAAVEATKEHMDDLKVDQTQAKRAREVAVATGKLVNGDGSHPIGSVRVDDVAAMIEFLTSHKLLGDKKTPKAAEVCVPLGQ